VTVDRQSTARRLRLHRLPFAQLSVARKGLVLVAIPLLFHLLFVILVVGVEREHRKQHESGLRSRHSLTAAYRLLGLMVDAETGMRGYVLTRNGDFLDPYRAAVLELPGRFAELRELSRVDEETPHFNSLAAAAASALEFQSATVEQIRSGDASWAVAGIESLEGKRRMDSFRDSMRRFLAAEEELARTADANSNAARTRLYAALALGFVADVFIALGLSVFFTRGIAVRLAAVTENTMRVERHEPLAPVLEPGDEIAALDAQLHEMAEAIDSAQAGLEEANRELAAFSYSISHDLRAPVRAVDGYARMLEEDYGDRLSDEGTRFLTTIRSEARRMGRLIDDLLAFSKLSRAEAQQAEVDVETLVREVVEQERQHRPATTAEIRIGDLPSVRCDRAMLRQVFINLVSNAVKFSAKGKNPVVEIGGQRHDGENLYWVRDNGAGFDMRYSDKLFGVFQRLHRFDEFEGTGVGLAIVKRIVTRHAGRVWAESSPGAGATFYFTLPNSPPTQNSGEVQS
jgi:signal transduction histidine kinase